jgi:outer membrane immunogenic protein
MKKVRTRLLATAAMVVLSGGAYAADMGVPTKAPAPIPLPIPSWQGFYIGGDVGAGRLNATAVATDPNSFGTCAARATACSTSATGFVGGVDVGYDWQDRYFVYGVAADWTWTGLKHTVTSRSGVTLSSFQAKVDWLASFRGRAGLAVDNTLVYLTGGVALAELKSSFSFTDNGGLQNTQSVSATRAGWVAGVGLEHKFGPNWSGYTELRYYDFGHESGSQTAGTRSIPYGSEFTHEVITSTVGIRYRW